MSVIVAVDFGSTFTKLVAIDIDAQRTLATAQSPTTVDTDVCIGLDKALGMLERSLGPASKRIERFIASSSAAGGLRMVAVGLVPTLTAEAAKRAALCAGAKLLEVFSNRLTRDELARLQALKPEIVLLVGGTDGGNSVVVLHNARAIAGSELSAPVLYAGNKVAADEVEAVLLAAGKEVHVARNVMPQIGVLDIDPAREVIRDIFMRRIVEAKGIARARGRIGDVLMPTPTAVLNAAQLLADGCADEPGIGDVVLFDVGGATTDVHSVCAGHPTRSDWIARGLPEPRSKRSVEGDLGLRWNAEGIVETTGRGRLKTLINDTALDVAARARALGAHPETLPESTTDFAFDTELAAAAVDVAMERHAGRVETVYGLSGPATLLHGKDLSSVRHLIGVGGVFAHGRGAGRILRAALAGPDADVSTRPRDAALHIDRDYVFFALGLLGTLHPGLAVRLLKNHLYDAEES